MRLDFSFVKLLALYKGMLRLNTREELLPKIHEYYENGFKEKTAYAEMRKKYLAYHDHNNRRRTYEFIKDQGY